MKATKDLNDSIAGTVGEIISEKLVRAQCHGRKDDVRLAVVNVIDYTAD